MICRECQVAGFLNADANRFMFTDPQVGDAIRALARSWHDDCPDKRKCTCQHILGQILSQDQIAELRKEPYVKAQAEETAETARWEADGGAGISGISGTDAA